MTLNSDGYCVSTNELKATHMISVILSTQENYLPLYVNPQDVKSLIPKALSSEIIIVHYDNSSQSVVNMDQNESAFSRHADNKDLHFKTTRENRNDFLHVKMKGKFTNAIMKTVEFSNGQFILIIDGDFPYPPEVIYKLIVNLINSPNSVIIASKYIKGGGVQKLPLLRTAISKGARLIVRHGLRVQHVHDPLSGCFGTSRSIIEDISIEGRGDELLLEIIVKLNGDKKYDKISVREIPYKQKGTLHTKKIDSSRISSYCGAVWHLYRYGTKSKRWSEQNDVAERKHKSVLFLSKAGRFFTVGASGLVVNYAISLLLSNIISNIWYLHATFVGIVVSISSNFILNKIWTFEDRNFCLKYFFRQYGFFVLLCSFGAAIQLFLVSMFVDYYHISYSISLITAVCIASLGNFILNKKITFGEKIWG